MFNVDFISGLVVGFVQGVLEWLPVSSSGQSMFLFLDYFGLNPGDAFSFGVFLHLGTLGAVIFRYHKVLSGLLSDKPLLRFLIISGFASYVSGGTMYIMLKMSVSEFNGEIMNFIIGLMLVGTGAILYHMRKKDYGVKDVNSLSNKDTVIVGLAQGFAIMPGISRSAVTVASLALNEIRQEEALKLSFLMSVPAVAAAVGVEVLSWGGNAPQIPWMTALAGLFASFIGGLLLMDILLKCAHKIRFDLFCMIFGVIAMSPKVLSLLLP